MTNQARCRCTTHPSKILRLSILLNDNFLTFAAVCVNISAFSVAASRRLITAGSKQSVSIYSATHLQVCYIPTAVSYCSHIHYEARSLSKTAAACYLCADLTCRFQLNYSSSLFVTLRADWLQLGRKIQCYTRTTSCLRVYVYASNTNTIIHENNVYLQFIIQTVFKVHLKETKLLSNRNWLKILFILPVIILQHNWFATLMITTKNTINFHLIKLDI